MTKERKIKNFLKLFCISGCSITFLPVFLKLLMVKPIDLLPWFVFPWKYTNITTTFNDEIINLQGYGISVLMPLLYFTIFMLTMTCCIFKISKKTKENKIISNVDKFYNL